MKSLSHLATLLFLLGLASTTNSVRADLGSAELDRSSQTFQAWCGKPKNDCTVSFENNKMFVNGKDSIDRSQVLRIWSDKVLIPAGFLRPQYYQDMHYVSYTKTDGTEGVGVFIFATGMWGNSNATSSKFWNQLQIFLGPERREIGPSIKIEK